MEYYHFAAERKTLNENLLDWFSLLLGIFQWSRIKKVSGYSSHLLATQKEKTDGTLI
jgi:hypothetical protein